MVRTSAVAALGLLLLVSLSGCLDGGAEENRLLVDWTDGFSVTVTGPLPSDARLVVTDTTDGKSETITDLRQTREGHHANTSFTPTAGHHYTLTVVADGKTLQERKLRAHETDGQLPTIDDEPFKARYGFDLFSQSDSMTMDLNGTMDATRGERFLLLVSATGDLKADQDGMTMDLVISRFHQEHIDDRVESFHMLSTGVWTMDEDGVQGTGDMRMEDRLIETTMWEDPDGEHHETDLTRLTMDMEGTITTYGIDGAMDVRRTEDTWSRVSDGQALWTRWDETIRYSVLDETGEEHDSGEGPPEEEEEDGGPDLTDLALFGGLVPAPPAPGDRHAQENELGVRMEFIVGEPETMTVLGHEVNVLTLTGTAVSRIEGTEVQRVVMDGALKGVTVSLEGHYRTEGQRLDSTITLLHHSG